MVADAERDKALPLSDADIADPKVAVVIPCYRVKAHVGSVIERIGSEIHKIYVIDDCCPDQSGRHVEAQSQDPRVQVVYHDQNRGVGGATMTGYRKAIEDGATVIVKVDGDGQMDPQLLPFFIAPILNGEADYTKGNRFFDPDDVRSMPLVRLLGNSVLSFLSKLSSGYWLIFDPTNGYTAIHASVARALPLDKIDQRYFFESDMLFRLNLLRARVVDIPMRAIYGDENSSLSVFHSSFSFMAKHLANFGKRLFYTYFLRDFSVASLELVFSLMFILFGISFGMYQWYAGIQTGVPASSGTVMLSALPIILGIQLMLGFLSFDIANQPNSVIHRHLRALRASIKQKTFQ